MIFKKISDRKKIDKYYGKRNTYHLSLAQGLAFTIESLKSEDSFTSFTDEILKGTADLSNLNLSPIIKNYLEQLKRNKTIIRSTNNRTIPPLNKFKKKYKNEKKVRQHHLQLDT